MEKEEDRFSARMRMRSSVRKVEGREDRLRKMELARRKRRSSEISKRRGGGVADLEAAARMEESEVDEERAKEICGKCAAMIKSGNNAEIAAALAAVSQALDVETVEGVLGVLMKIEDEKMDKINILKCIGRMASRSAENAKLLSERLDAIEYVLINTNATSYEERAEALWALSMLLDWEAMADKCGGRISEVLARCVRAARHDIRREALWASLAFMRRCDARSIAGMEKLLIAVSEIVDAPSEQLARVSLKIIETALERTSKETRRVSMCGESTLATQLHRLGFMEKIVSATSSPHESVVQASYAVMNTYFFEYCEEGAVDADMSEVALEE